jgi:hypothetical protein
MAASSNVPLYISSQGGRVWFGCAPVLGVPPADEGGGGGYTVCVRHGGRDEEAKRHFQRGVIVPGIPILLGGCEDRTLIRSLIEAGKWLNWSGAQFLKETWGVFERTLLESGQGGTYMTEVFRHTMPDNLSNCHGHSALG